MITCLCEVKVTQSCPTLCDPMNYTVHGIFQARILEWGAFPETSPRDIPNPGIEPRSPTLQVDSLPMKLSGEPQHIYIKAQFLNLSIIIPKVSISLHISDAKFHELN